MRQSTSIPRTSLNASCSAKNFFCFCFWNFWINKEFPEFLEMETSAVREAGVSLGIVGHNSGPLKTSSDHHTPLYCIEGFKGGPELGPIMPRDAKLSAYFFASLRVYHQHNKSIYNEINIFNHFIDIYCI